VSKSIKSDLNRELLREYLRKREYWKIKKPSTVMQFLYDADEFYRFRGAEALGYLCRGQTAKNFILRLFWHLSDESGAYCVGAPIGIAEIGRANPEAFEPGNFESELPVLDVYFRCLRTHTYFKKISKISRI